MKKWILWWLRPGEVVMPSMPWGRYANESDARAVWRKNLNTNRMIDQHPKTTIHREYRGDWVIETPTGIRYTPIGE